jgi:hypothetical protein
MARHRAPNNYTSPVPPTGFAHGRHSAEATGLDGVLYRAPNRRPLRVGRSPLRVALIALALAVSWR